MDFVDRIVPQLLIVLVCLYYGYKVVALRDISSLRNKNQRPLSGPEKTAFIKEATNLILIFGVGAVVDILISLVSPVASAVFFAGVIVYEVIQWKKLGDKYK